MTINSELQYNSMKFKTYDPSDKKWTVKSYKTKWSYPITAQFYANDRPFWIFACYRLLKDRPFSSLWTIHFRPESKNKLETIESNINSVQNIR